MNRHLRLLIVVPVIVACFSACSTKPDHRRYIPKDAALVAGINLQSLGKTIAWNMITGSKLYKEMQKHMPQKKDGDMMSGLDKAGIDGLNTFYVYLKTDQRYKGGVNATALVPLADANQWESFVKKNYPQAAIKEHANIKSTSLGTDMYVGWNKDVLIVMNMTKTAAENMPTNSAAADGYMVAEMETAFKTNAENSITTNKSFENLEKPGHDLTLWLNYEQIMNQYMNENAASQMSGMSLSPSIWKESSLACGFDFKKGKIAGNFTWYSANEMNEVYKTFGGTNADKELVKHLPGNDLDMMIAGHLAPKAVRMLLDKTNTLGLLNAGLASQNMDADKVLDAFTGDMGFAVNGLQYQAEATNAPAKPTANVCFVMKINKKENFNHIIDIAKSTGEFLPYQNGYALRLSAQDTVFVFHNDQFMAISNKKETAADALRDNAQPIPETIAAAASAHPFAMYADLQRCFQNINPGAAISPADSTIYADTKRLLTNVQLTGGNYSNGATAFQMEVNFTNKDENSLLTLLDYGMRVSEVMNRNAQPKMPQNIQDDTTNQNSSF